MARPAATSKPGPASKPSTSPKADKRTPAVRELTGPVAEAIQQPGGRLTTAGPLTTAQGVRVDDTNHSIRSSAGRGPTLIEDHHLREKIMHFDHERIPERVVHARGAGAHGTFRVYKSIAKRHLREVPG